MANPEHLEILKQGVKVWNKWRKKQVDLRPDLCGVDLQRASLIRADFAAVDLRDTNLKGADLWMASLVGARLQGACLKRANLAVAQMHFANLSNSDITGACLWGTSRDDWKIDDIKCDYVYWKTEPLGIKSSELKKWLKDHRIPKDRDFHPGEFEELYNQLPIFVYYFEHGFTPIDAVVMDQVVTAINEKHPEFELKLDSFHSRGQPHAKFTVLHKDSIEEVRKQVASEYEGKIRYLEGQRDQLRELFSTVVNRPQIMKETIQEMTITEKIDTVKQENEEYKNIRKLIDKSFDADGLETFCHDNFHAVYNKFTSGQTKDKMVLMLVDHVRSQGLRKNLLSLIQESNPYQYDRFKSQQSDSEKDDPKVKMWEILVMATSDNPEKAKKDIQTFIDRMKSFKTDVKEGSETDTEIIYIISNTEENRRFYYHRIKGVIEAMVNAREIELEDDIYFEI